MYTFQREEGIYRMTDEEIGDVLKKAAAPKQPKPITGFTRVCVYTFCIAMTIVVCQILTHLLWSPIDDSSSKGGLVGIVFAIIAAYRILKTENSEEIYSKALGRGLFIGIGMALFVFGVSIWMQQADFLAICDLGADTVGQALGYSTSEGSTWHLWWWIFSTTAKVPWLVSLIGLGIAFYTAFSD
jgi:hypothetical protein